MPRLNILTDNDDEYSVTKIDSMLLELQKLKQHIVAKEMTENEIDDAYQSLESQAAATRL